MRISDWSSDVCSYDLDSFRELLDGKVAGEQLGTFRDGRLEHRPGWDVTLSAPKSASIMAAVAGDRRLIVAHCEAARPALAHGRRHMAATRRPAGGPVDSDATGKRGNHRLPHGHKT